MIRHRSTTINQHNQLSFNHHWLYPSSTHHPIIPSSNSPAFAPSPRLASAASDASNAAISARSSSWEAPKKSARDRARAASGDSPKGAGVPPGGLGSSFASFFSSVRDHQLGRNKNSSRDSPRYTTEGKKDLGSSWKFDITRRI